MADNERLRCVINSVKDKQNCLTELIDLTIRVKIINKSPSRLMSSL